MLLAKEARIIPTEAKTPPTIITGRQPNLFTSTLHRGPKNTVHRSVHSVRVQSDISGFMCYTWVPVPYSMASSIEEIQAVAL